MIFLSHLRMVIPSQSHLLDFFTCLCHLHFLSNLRILYFFHFVVSTRPSKHFHLSHIHLPLLYFLNASGFCTIGHGWSFYHFISVSLVRLRPSSITERPLITSSSSSILLVFLSRSLDPVHYHYSFLTPGTGNCSPSSRYTLPIWCHHSLIH